ncbi:unnamed protein product [Musa textilis]
MVFSSIPFQPDLPSSMRLPSSTIKSFEEEGPNTPLTTLYKWFTLLQDFSRRRRVRWHPHKHCLAFVSGPSQVSIGDYEDSDGKDPCILASDFQRGIKTLEWRPNSGKMLSVACK